MNKLPSYIAASGRLLIALIFLISGFGKIAAPAMTLGYIASAGLPLPLVGYLIAIAVEIGGATLLVLVFHTRIVALVMAIFTVAAAFSFHRNFADPNQLMHFLKNVSMTGGLLQVVAFGAGGFGIDGRLASARGVASA